MKMTSWNENPFRLDLRGIAEPRAIRIKMKIYNVQYTSGMYFITEVGPKLDIDVRYQHRIRTNNRSVIIYHIRILVL